MSGQIETVPGARTATRLEPPDLDEYWDTRDVAQVCRTSESTVRYWRHAGKGPACATVGRRVLYKPADVRRWLAECFAADPSAPGNRAS